MCHYLTRSLAGTGSLGVMDTVVLWTAERQKGNICDWIMETI